MAEVSEDSYYAGSSSDEEEDLVTVAANHDDEDDRGHFDLADVLSVVKADDPLPQSDIYEGLFLQQEGVEASGPTWEQAKMTTFKLSVFAWILENNQAAAAIALLHRRVNLSIYSNLSPSLDDNMLMWDGSKHFLDFMLVVAESMGCHAFLPNTVADHTFTITLDLRQSYHQFRPKYGKLGFNPTRSMMAIGTNGSSELWFGFCPITNIEDLTVANEAPLLSEKHGDSRLSGRHFRMAVMFLAYALSTNPDLGIHVTHPYGMEDDVDGWRVTDATNVYSQRTWQLHLEDVEKLSDCIIESWDDWVEGSPHCGKRMAGLWSINLSLRVEGANWQAERLYAQIRYMSPAIATDITATKVNQWEDISNEQILLNHEAVYDSLDPLVRQEVDLEELPHQDPETEDENKVYDKGGRRIPWHMGMVALGTKSCGILVNLETVPELFSSFIPDDEDMVMDPDVYEDQDIRTPLVNVYPQAFLRKTGHMQCNTVLPQFGPFLTKIRKSVAQPLRGVDDDLDEEDEKLFNHDDGEVPPVVLSMACQFYNELSHWTCPSAALHEVQQGRITSALSGAYGTGCQAALNHPNIIRECEASLPHQHFDNKIKHDDVPRALRLENVYIIQLDSLLPGHRTGKRIYWDIIIPLA
ncbi:hypothetical protein BDR07DRAFT_1494309 [Suillus spraguei]|nr:hypothetical protein BDR07DRAFT_1494309 [Suillus spraguei]